MSLIHCTLQSIIVIRVPERVIALRLSILSLVSQQGWMIYLSGPIPNFCYNNYTFLVSKGRRHQPLQFCTTSKEFVVFTKCNV